MPGESLYIGLMSGTSLDGVDGVMCGIDLDAPRLTVIRHAHQAFEPALRERLMALQTSGPDELHHAALAANALARAYAAVVDELLRGSGHTAADLRAVGAHGQTVRHQPGLHDGTGYTLQIHQPALLAELCGIDVIADFRSRDVAAGGQGAPLVPPFHRFMFGQADRTVGVVNIGGISNLTVLEPGQPPRGFDCGPGNVLMDHWIGRHRGLTYDHDGAWAASGRVRATLLQRCCSEPYLHQPPPKSTGRDLFSPAWLDTLLSAEDLEAPPEDVQATLCEFTARVIAADLRAHAPRATRLLVCGGGAFNGDLMRRLAGLLPGVTVQDSDAAGLPALEVEAAAFAWLAACHVHRRPASEAAVTGARGARVLGACYPA
ncbi:anhydro-N-acetylmuramic acid kinase [Sphaerotilus hippei]|uniref:Anhydro-N-acetylmuramic acid kinase n=1 Tax=Sphaerotilus hippei TaxID=744406 RepID=A0A318H9W8_9BURK|nr:anhydro-N-acetylmuramic acid kinase [Sphaerotilus hippei]PXW97087.1 anhydro-N-acetylmuramic acid kinase [Sphaerotilus hippei]